MAVNDDLVIAARRRTATVVGILTLAGVTALVTVLALVANHGVMTYALDDPFIHLTMARNLAHAGTYGVVPGMYESASSSPGWVALLAVLLKVVPDAGAVWLPLALNLVAAAGVLILVLRAQSTLFILSPAPLRGVAYVALPLALFLPALVLIGMEHTLHVLLVLALLLLLDRALRRRLTEPELAAVALISLLAGAVRYETLFVAAGAVIALVAVRPDAVELHRFSVRVRRPELIALLLPPVAVTVVLGAINLAHGQYFLPNSLVAKTGLASGTGPAVLVPDATSVFLNFIDDLQFAALVVVGLSYLALRRLRGATSGLWLAWVIAAALQLAYARSGWYERYQAYLVVSGTVLALRSVVEAGRHRAWVAGWCVALVGVLPASKFGLEAHLPVASHQIYQEQYEMARFLAGAYAGQTVFVNDIGEVSWQHRGGIDDLWALGSSRILHAYVTREMGSSFVAQLATRDGVRVAAVFPELRWCLPDGWTRVATWSPPDTGPPDNGKSVEFYAAPGDSVVRLRRALQAFASSMAPDMALRWG